MYKEFKIIYSRVLLVLFLLAASQSFLAAQGNKLSESDVVSRLKNITRLWLSDTIFIQADIIMTSGFSGAPAFDSVTLPVLFWKTNDQVYGKFGEQEWIENDSILLLVDLQQKIMKLELKEGKQGVSKNGFGMFKELDSLAGLLEKGEWKADLFVENGFETLRLSTKDFLAEKQWPAGESSIKIQLSTGLPQSINSIERKMQLVDSSWEQAWNGLQKPFIVKAVVDRNNKQAVSIAISENRSQYLFSEMSFGGNLRVPVKPFDRIEKDGTGGWKTVGAFQPYELMYVDY